MGGNQRLAHLRGLAVVAAARLGHLRGEPRTTLSVETSACGLRRRDPVLAPDDHLDPETREMQCARQAEPHDARSAGRKRVPT
jgi:hypothetical protein